MIAPAIVAEVRRLLSETPLSQRKIAEVTGVSHGTVSAIASGRRPDYEGLQQRPDEWCQDESGSPQRCGGCGGLVYMPCRFCRAMEEAAKGKKRPKGDSPIFARAKIGTVPFGALEEITLDLRPEHQARYEEVCRWRQENGGEPALVGDAS